MSSYERSRSARECVKVVNSSSSAPVSARNAVGISYGRQAESAAPLSRERTFVRIALEAANGNSVIA